MDTSAINREFAQRIAFGRRPSATDLAILHELGHQWYCDADTPLELLAGALAIRLVVTARDLRDALAALERRSAS